MAGSAVVGWKLDSDERSALLLRLPPAFPDAVANHVTLKSHVGPDEPLPPAATGEIVGEATDGVGVQAMIVCIDGTTDRPGGGTYHITWSLDRAAGRTAIESNDVIAQRGWSRIDPPIAVSLTPALMS